MRDGTMAGILAGVAHFQTDVFPEHRDHFHALAEKQSPQVLFLTCADSRVDPSLLTQSRPGQLFICRNIGNLVPPHGTTDGGVATVMEYAVDVLKVKHIVVCGHSDCGAIKSLLDPTDDLIVPQVTAWLRYAETARRVGEVLHANQTGKELLRAVTEHNIVAQLANLRTYPAVAVGLVANRLELHGWYYDIGEGLVFTYNHQGATFEPLKG